MKKIALLSTIIFSIAAIIVVFLPKTSSNIPFFGKKEHKNLSIILVHGTFSKNEPWFKPSGEFHKQLKKSFEKIKTSIIPFAWSGELTCYARLEGAFNLALKILEISKKSRIITIGHSHGANVINFASTLIDLAKNDKKQELSERLDEIVNKLRHLAFDEHMTGVGVLSAAHANTQSKDEMAKTLRSGQNIARKAQAVLNMLKIKQLDNSIKSFCGSLEKFAGLLEMCGSEEEDPTYRDGEGLKNLLSNYVQKIREIIKTTPEVNLEQPIIESSYLMACPVDEIAYCPSKRVIKHTYSLYSHGDMVQRLMGAYKRQFPQTLAHVTNVAVYVRQHPKEDQIEHLGHGDFKKPFIGKWITKSTQKLAQLSESKDLNMEFYKNFQEPQAISDEQIFKQYKPKRTLVALAKNSENPTSDKFENRTPKSVLEWLKKLV
ncbi:hypothetical protein ACFLY6_00345 [Candidatus Dependentiae bacterium]